MDNKGVSFMAINRKLIDEFYEGLDERSRASLLEAVSRVVSVKQKGGKVAVVTGSGPNLHEGVTTLIAELMDKGIVDSVTTSSAVIIHEMGGVLDRVKMCDASVFGFDEKKMPRGNIFEFTEMTDRQLDGLRREMPLDEELLRKGARTEGRMVIK
ncbi:MAG TPA: hypothetical protein PLX82_10310, partial [Smithellaceae bacterium]|nr:hypothetical protein [Smithellaceae bacterium]